MEDDQFWPKRPVGVVNSKNEGALRFERNYYITNAGTYDRIDLIVYREQQSCLPEEYTITALLFTKRVHHNSCVVYLKSLPWGTAELFA